MNDIVLKPKLKPTLVGGPKKDTAAKATNKPAKTETSKPAKTASKPAKAKKTDKPAKAVKSTAGKAATFASAVSTPIKAEKVDFANGATVANAILAATVKAFNSKFNVAKITKEMLGAINPNHKKIVGTIVGQTFGEKAIEHEVGKIAKKIDSIVANAVKAAAKGKLDKPGLNAAIEAAISIFSEKPKKSTKPAKPTKAKAADKSAKPAKAKMTKKTKK